MISCTASHCETTRRIHRGYRVYHVLSLVCVLSVSLQCTDKLERAEELAAKTTESDPARYTALTP